MYYFIKVINLGLLLIVLMVQWKTSLGYPNPDFGDFFRRSNWVDKIPSLEVKFAPTGVTVSTGPSREELYWTIGYIVGGVAAFILVSVAICFCMSKLYSRRGSTRRDVIVREVPMSPLMMGLGVNPYLGNAAINNPLLNPAVLNSHYAVGFSPVDQDVRSPQARDCSPITSSARGYRNENHNEHLSKGKYLPTSQAEESPPPPYRSTR